MDVNHINPFVKSISNVFAMMLGCEIRRTGLKLKSSMAPSFDVTGVIGLSGKVNGSVVLSLSRRLALKTVENMLGEEATEINEMVADAVGELTNMVAGSAKAELSEYDLSLGAPNVIVGRHHVICFPKNVRPICIHFDSQWGAISLEVGLESPTADPPPGEASTQIAGQT